MGSQPQSAELYRLMGLSRKGRGYNFSYTEVQSCEVDWEAVARRLETHPQDASVSLQFGSSFQYPLEISLDIIERPVPPNIVEALIKACPKSIDRHTPLLATLCNRNTTVEVWMILLAHACATVVSDGNFLHRMLHYGEDFQTPQGLELLKSFLEVVPRALHDRNEYSRLPILIALESNAPLEVIRHLLVEGMKQHVGWKFGAGGLFSILSEERDEVSVLQGAIKAYQFNMTDECRDILIECFKAAGSALAKVDTMEGYPPIHGAIQCGTLCIMTDLIKERVLDFHAAVDPLGRTTLDVALIAAGEGIGAGKFQNARWRGFLQTCLLGANDGVAAKVRPDGNLPLHVAIEFDFSAEQGLNLIVAVHPRAVACYDANGEVPLHLAVKRGHVARGDGLECIMAACPRAAICRDTKTGMYPFMLAGCAPKSNVDTIYMMLRKDPAAVQGGIHPSAQEIYLAKKNKENRTRFAEEKAKFARIEQRRGPNLKRREKHGGTKRLHWLPRMPL